MLSLGRQCQHFVDLSDTQLMSGALLSGVKPHLEGNWVSEYLGVPQFLFLSLGLVVWAVLCFLV